MIQCAAFQFYCVQIGSETPIALKTGNAVMDTTGTILPNSARQQ